MSSVEELLKNYTKRYRRIEDGREFLCRNITPKDCRMYDTVLGTFESMGTTKRSKLFKSIGPRYHSANPNRPRVLGSKVRELRKAGVQVIGGQGDWE